MADRDKLIAEVIAYFATGIPAQEFGSAVAQVAYAVVADEAAHALELIGGAGDDFSHLQQEWASTSAERFYRITTNTASHVCVLVVDDVRAGIATSETIRDVEDYYRICETTRSGIIARSETAAAANFGAFGVYRDEGIPSKSWVSILQGQVRDSHRAANGQSRVVREHFDVGGVQLMYPGDPSAPIRETINCRCTIFPETIARMGAVVSDRLWLGFLRRTTSWEVRMALTAREKFQKQRRDLVAMMRAYV